MPEEYLKAYSQNISINETLEIFYSLVDKRLDEFKYLAEKKDIKSNEILLKRIETKIKGDLSLELKIKYYKNTTLININEAIALLLSGLNYKNNDIEKMVEFYDIFLKNIAIAVFDNDVDKMYKLKKLIKGILNK